jgi:hypothetical protein
MIRKINAKFAGIVTIAGLKIIRLCQQTKACRKGNAPFAFLNRFGRRNCDGGNLLKKQYPDSFKGPWRKIFDCL